jgi:hypothetical protein
MVQFVDLLPQLPFPEVEPTISLSEIDVEGGLRLWALVVICILIFLVVLVAAACLARCFAGRPVNLQFTRLHGLQLNLGGPRPAAPSPSVRTSAPASGVATPLVVATVAVSLV